MEGPQYSPLEEGERWGRGWDAPWPGALAGPSGAGISLLLLHPRQGEGIMAAPALWLLATPSAQKVLEMYVGGGGRWTVWNLRGTPPPPLLHKLMFVVNPVTWGGGLQEKQDPSRSRREVASLHKGGVESVSAAAPP